MHNSGGKHVNGYGTASGKSGVLTSTVLARRVLNDIRDSAKAVVVPHLPSFFPQQLYTLILAVSPLIEHYFYPVSTAPITSPTNKELKKGIQ